MREARFGIDKSWLEAVAGKTLFYPAAGRDTAVFIDAFSPFVSEYLFNDLHYSSATDALPFAPPRFSVRHEDAPPQVLRDASITQCGRWRDIAPSMLEQRLQSEDETIIVRRRRGFGQYALQELPARSVGVFVHRGDSIGEGGSNMWFLANVRKRHEPLSNLWDKLKIRLADKAIVVSDGSLTHFEFIKTAVSQARDSEDVHIFGGFLWQQIGVCKDLRHRNAVVWGLEREAATLRADR